MYLNKETLESPAPATRFSFFYPSLYCFYFAMIVLFVSYLSIDFLFNFIFETLRTMFGLSVGEGVNRLFFMTYLRNSPPITTNIVIHYFKVFYCVSYNKNLKEKNSIKV